MKRILTLLTASLLASAVIATPALSQGNSGKSMGKGNGAASSMGGGASDLAPGQMKRLESGAGAATDFAPGQIKGDGESARDYAPGQLKKENSADADVDVDSGTTASTAKGNFGTVISSIRAGKSDLSAVTADTEVNVVPVDELIEGNNRSALDNALSDNQDQIDQLRADLGGIEGLEGLSEEQIDAAVAARVEADGSLTVYTD